MTSTPLGRKQSLTPEAWDAALATIEESVPTADLEALIDRTVDDVRTMTRGKNVAYGWSGGKDSIALRWIIEQATPDMPSWITLAPELEWPEFLKWVDAHRPAGLEVREAPLTYQWLRDHPEQLFPQDYPHRYKWFTQNQHAGMYAYQRDHQPDFVLLGRRRQDGNYIGPKGSSINTNRRGLTVWSPLADWKHEHIIALTKYAGLQFPDVIYRSHPRGFIVGTGPWAKRGGTSLNPDAPNYGWREVHDIDPTVVHRAADENIPGAALYLKENE